MIYSREWHSSMRQKIQPSYSLYFKFQTRIINKEPYICSLIWKQQLIFRLFYLIRNKYCLICVGYVIKGGPYMIEAHKIWSCIVFPSWWCLHFKYVMNKALIVLNAVKTAPLVISVSFTSNGTSWLFKYCAGQGYSVVLPEKLQSGKWNVYR